MPQSKYIHAHGYEEKGSETEEILSGTAVLKPQVSQKPNVQDKNIAVLDEAW